MADVVTTYTRTGFGQRLMQSVMGAFIGFFLFLASFAVLWWNEGNVVAEKGAINEMGKNMVSVDAAKVDPTHDGKLVHASAMLQSSEKLGDQPYLNPGPYLKLDRSVEMFQWVEHKETSTEKKTGGSSVTKTTYKYSKEWHSGAVDSSRFEEKKGHGNPGLAVDDHAQKVSSATFGGYNGLSLVERLSANDTVKVTPDQLANPAFEIHDGKVYLQKNAQPEVGDVRITYNALNAGEFTIVAVQEHGPNLAEYAASNGKSKFLVERGHHTGPQMITMAIDEAKTMAMVLRVIGFLMMFFGAFMMLNPIATFLDFLPIVGSLGRFGIGLATFAGSLALSLVTIVLGMIAHNPIVLGIVLIGSGVGAFFLWKKGRERKAQKAAGATPGQPLQVVPEPQRKAG